MIKSEIRFLYKPVITIQNQSFQNLGNGWSGNTIVNQILPSSLVQGQTQSYNMVSGWTFQTIEGNNSAYMQSNLGSDEPIWQDLDPVENSDFDSGAYSITFDVRGLAPDNTATITPYLYGVAGTPVSANGRVTQTFQITGATLIGTQQILFQPQTGFGGGISNVNVTVENSIIMPIDLYDDDSYNLTFENFSDVSNKSSNYSKTIKLPGTNNNNKAFKFILDENMYFYVGTGQSYSNVMFFNKRIPAGLYYDTVQLIVGYFELEKVIRNQFFIEYEGTFYSQVRNLADSIGDKSLYNNDNALDNLDFSEYNHEYNLANIIASYNTSSPNYTGSTGYFYPFIDFQGFEDGNILDFTCVRPALYVKQIWDKIFEKAGFQYTSSFLSGSTEFKSLIIPLTKNVAVDSFEMDKKKFCIGTARNASGATAGVGYGLYKHPSATPGFEYWNGTGTAFPPTYWFKTDLHDFVTRGADGASRSMILPFNVGSGCLTNGSGSTYFFNNTGATGLAFNTTSYSWDVKRSGSYKLHAFVTYDLYGKPFNGANADFTGSWYAGDQYGQYNQFEVKLTFFRIRHAGTNFVMENISETVNDVYIDTQTIFAEYPGTKGEDWIAINQTIENDLQAVDLYEGERIKVQMSIAGGIERCSWHSVGVPPVGGYGSYINAWVHVNRTFSYFSNDYNNIPYLMEGNNVDMNQLLPEMKQIDFVKSVCNMYNLTISEDKDVAGNLVIEPFDTFYKPEYVDWTTKVDLDNKEIERIPDIINKSVLFTGQKDSNDDLSKKYIEEFTNTSGSFVIQNPYINEGTLKIETQFSTPMLKNFGATNWVMSCLYNESKRTEWTTDGKRSDQTYGPKILSRKVLTNNTADLSGKSLNTIYIRSYLTGTTISAVGNQMVFKPGDWGFGSNTIRNYFPYAGHLNTPYNPTYDINFGVSKYYYSKENRFTTFNLFKNYWKTKMSYYLDPNSKKVKFRIRLNQSDIANLDFRKRIKVENTFYLVSRIVDWTPDQMCDVELIKLQYYDLNYTIDTPTWKTQITNGCSTTGGGTPLKATGGGTGTGTVINLQPPSLLRSVSVGSNENIDLMNFANNDNSWPQGAYGLVMGKNNQLNSSNFFVNGDNNIVDVDNVTLLNSKNNTIQQNNYLLIGSDNNQVLFDSGYTTDTYSSDSGWTGTTLAPTPGVMINSFNNTVNNSRSVLINSNDNIINTGLTDVVLMNSKNLTITQSGKTYLNNKDIDTFADIPYVDTKSGETLAASQSYTDTKVSGITSGVTADYVNAQIATATGNTLSTVSGSYYSNSDNIVLAASKNVLLPSNGALYIGDKDTDGTWMISLSGTSLSFQVRSGGSYSQKGDIPSSA